MSSSPKGISSPSMYPVIFASYLRHNRVVVVVCECACACVCVCAHVCVGTR
jgi:hypothetical protein